VGCFEALNWGGGAIASFALPEIPSTVYVLGILGAQLINSLVEIILMSEKPVLFLQKPP
jgi:hypothetical protein